MNRLRMPMALILLVVGIMLLVNLINIPRGPLLNCYKNVTTYHRHPASYGFPFVFMRGNPTGDDCNIVYENGFYIQPYNDYHFERQALALDVGVTILLAVITYLAAQEISKKKVFPRPTHRTRAPKKHISTKAVKRRA